MALAEVVCANSEAKDSAKTGICLANNIIRKDAMPSIHYSPEKDMCGANRT
jgi:hypothetical protein